MTGLAVKRWLSGPAIAVAVLGLVSGLAYLSFFSVDATEYAVVTEFGDPVQVITKPGLGMKLPYQTVHKFDRRLYVYTPALSEFLTLEKTAVVASAAVLWRISEPRKFFETVFNRAGADSRLGDILFAGLGGAIGRNPLSAFVEETPGEYRAEAILEQMTAKIRATAGRDYGIEVVDVRLQRFDFPRRNRLRVYSRMKSERGRISMKHRSEGEEEGLKIRAAADEKKAHILAEAYKIAEQHRGQGEADATRLYADALSAAPDFYKFLRAMEASKKVLKRNTALLLPADSELFGLLHSSDYFDKSDQLVKDTKEGEEVNTLEMSE